MKKTQEKGKSWTSSPVLWGIAVCCFFYALLHYGWIQSELLVRYCASHEVEYVTVAMFCIGMVLLIQKYFFVRKQRKDLTDSVFLLPDRSTLNGLNTSNNNSVLSAEQTPTRLNQYGQIPTQKKMSKKAYLDFCGQALQNELSAKGSSILGNRLVKVIEFLRRQPNEDLDDELRYLSEDDALRAESDYGLVRMFIWAIPILGFLGTVMGITMALGSLDLTALETTGSNLADGLKVAFDTTALALSLVFLLYFSMFFVQKEENRFLSRLDRLVEERIGRLRLFSSARQYRNNGGKETLSLKHLSVQLQTLMERQTDCWIQAIGNLNGKSQQMALDSADLLRDALRSAFEESVRDQEASMKNREEHLLRETLRPAVSVLTQNVSELTRHSQNLTAFQQKMTEQSELLRQILSVTGEIASLEERLRQNLGALETTQCFQETMNTLAATVQLMNTKQSFRSGNPSLNIAGLNIESSFNSETTSNSAMFASNSDSSSSAMSASNSDSSSSTMFASNSDSSSSAMSTSNSDLSNSAMSASNSGSLNSASAEFLKSDLPVSRLNSTQNSSKRSSSKMRSNLSTSNWAPQGESTAHLTSSESESPETLRCPEPSSASKRPEYSEHAKNASVFTSLNAFSVSEDVASASDDLPDEKKTTRTSLKSRKAA